MATKKLMTGNRKVQAILAVCGLALVGGLPAATISYVADETVSVPLALTEDTTIEVAAGKTVILSLTETSTMLIFRTCVLLTST